jgi:hypothetical protein
LISLNREKFLSRFATMVLLAEHLDASAQGPKVCALLILSPKHNIPLDDSFVLRVCESLKARALRQLLRLRGLALMRSQTFFRMIHLFQRAILLAKDTEKDSDVELLAQILVDYARYNPRHRLRIASPGLYRIVTQYASRGRVSIAVTCLEIFLGERLEDNVSKLKKMYNEGDQWARQSIIDTLAVSSETQPHVLDILRREPPDAQLVQALERHRRVLKRQKEVAL